MTTLRRLRERQHWSLRDAADHIGIHHTHVLRLEQGHHYPSRKTALRLAAAYGVPERTIWTAATNTARAAQR